MSSSPVAELEAGLNAMLSLKPPGVSGSRIQSITTLCTENVQSESVLVQKLYTHFRKAPGSHKLGVLYVVDSVTRKWTEQAKSAGQPINSSAQDGTFAAGVHRVKELLPALMNDITQSAPNDQKEKIKKLVDIWEKSSTFPLDMLTSFREKLNTPQTSKTVTIRTEDALNFKILTALFHLTDDGESTTPQGSPPEHLRGTFGAPQPGAPVNPPAPNTSSILEALANMARQNQSTAAPPAMSSGPPQDGLYNVSNAQNNPAQQSAAMTQPMLLPPVAPPVNVPGMATFAPLSQTPNSAAQNYNNTQTNAFANMPALPSHALSPAIQQQLIIAKALADQGVPHDKIMGIITAMGSQGLSAPGAGVTPAPASQYAGHTQNAISQNTWSARPDESRDRNGYHAGDGMRSPQGRYRRRSRSPSPARGWGARDSPARRRDETNEYGRDSPNRNWGGDGRGHGNNYRERSPQRRQSSTPPITGGSKWVGYDDSIGSGNIKVLSRTLFVGGVTSGEYELRSIFERFGKVQTCIVNKEKRHAFVKMVSRADAVAAKEGMEKTRIPDSQLRTRWGVGFGPRDCSDYQTGVSIIPISKLTDADKKWMLSAEFGGSGGAQIEQYMVVEEPDIEIGQGVSSKAISRRMQTDKGGNNGPKSSRDHEEDDGHRYRRGGVDRDDRRENRRDDDRKSRFPSVSGPPAMPSIPPFGMPGFPQFTMPTLPNGMPMMPPGFVFPGQAPGQPQQPPPPGHRT